MRPLKRDSITLIVVLSFLLIYATIQGTILMAAYPKTWVVVMLAMMVNSLLFLILHILRVYRQWR